MGMKGRSMGMKEGVHGHEGRGSIGMKGEVHGHEGRGPWA